MSAPKSVCGQRWADTAELSRPAVRAQPRLSGNGASAGRTAAAQAIGNGPITVSNAGAHGGIEGLYRGRYASCIVLHFGSSAIFAGIRKNTDFIG